MGFASSRERDEAIRAAHAAGKTGRWMRKELGVASGTIRKVLQAVGVSSVKHPWQRTDWTDEKIAVLERLWTEGASFADIAKATGSTRRSVERKGQSLGLPPKAAAPDGPKRKAGAPVRRVRVAQKITHIPDRSDAPASLELTLMDLNPFHCRWITSGEGAGARFCGHVAIKAYGYCEAHHAIAYVPAESRPRQRTDYHLYRRAA